MRGKTCICIVLTCLILLGCGSTPDIPATVKATWTPLLTKTDMPTLTATLTPLPTETQTPLPTLEPEQAEEAIKELLWNNPNCLAPCFMGIIPDQTTLDEAKAIFMHLGLDLEQTDAQDNKKFYAVIYELSSGLSIHVRLVVQSGIVRNLDVPFTPPHDQSSNAPREWLPYSPETLINKNGLPSKVKFFVDRGPRPSYAMNLYFDAVDLIIEYYSYDLGPNLRICPLTDQVDSVRIWIGKDPEYPPPYVTPLKEGTSLTIEEFANLMTGNPGQACFDLREEAFP